MNEGKKFEQDFKKSIPDTVYYYRLRDGTAAWDGGENTRFQAMNICDYLMYDGDFYMIELKSHKGKSIPYTAFRDNQIEGLCNASEYGVKAGFIINMRDTGETFFVTAKTIEKHIATADRKSVPIEYMRDNGYIIKAEKKRTRWRYDIQDMLKNMELNNKRSQ